MKLVLMKHKTFYKDSEYNTFKSFCLDYLKRMGVPGFL